MMNTLPKFLYITNVKTGANLGVIGMGGFGRVYKARYKGREVALKEVHKSRHDVSTLPFSPNNTADANSFWQGFIKKRLFVGSHCVAIPLSPFYPPLLGNI